MKPEDGKFNLSEVQLKELSMALVGFDRTWEEIDSLPPKDIRIAELMEKIKLYEKWIIALQS